MRAVFPSLLALALTAGSPAAHAQVKAEHEQRPSSKEILEAQISSNTRLAHLPSPWLEEFDTKTNQTTPVHSRRQERSILGAALIEIDDNLLRAFGSHWETDKAKIGQTNDISDVRKLYLREGQRTFLLVTQLLDNGRPVAFKEGWAYSFPDLPKKVRFEPLRSSSAESASLHGSVTTIEPCDANRKRTLEDGFLSCLFFVKDVAQRTDPIFNIKVGGLQFHNREGLGPWRDSSEPVELSFRFETSGLNILGGIERSVKWSAIKSQYVEPHRAVMSSSVGLSDGGVGNQIASFMWGVATRIVSTVLLRGLGFR